MSLDNAKAVSVIDVITSGPRQVLSDAALKADTNHFFSRHYNRYTHGYGWSRSTPADADDVVTKTINNVESFIHKTIKFAVFFAGLALFAMGAKTGLMVGGAIALGSFLVIRVLNKKLSDIKDEYAKIYSWSFKHFRSRWGAIFTGVPLTTYKLVNRLY